MFIARPRPEANPVPSAITLIGALFPNRTIMAGVYPREVPFSSISCRPLSVATRIRMEAVLKRAGKLNVVLKMNVVWARRSHHRS